MTAPLAGIKVVEIASFVAAPAGGALLADLGAEVIKVEVAGGETLRHARPGVLGWKSDFSESPHFHMDNRGKRSLVLDIQEPTAREALLRVIDGADVVLTNMLPGRLLKYGLDPDLLRSTRPRLIVATLTGYGRQGDEADTPAFDYAAFWARTGLMDLLRDPESTPAFLRPGLGDHAAALALVTGILSALRVRDAGGEGQVVDVNLMHIGFYMQGNDAAPTLTVREDPPPHDRRRPRNPLWNQYPTKDGRWLFLVMIESQRYWPALCRALGKPELLEDERFEDAIPRYRHREELTAILEDVFLTRSLAGWEAQLAGQPLIWAPVRTLEEATHDPQAHANGVFAELEHPEAGPFGSVTAPLTLSAHAMPGDRLGPELGADSTEVLREAGLEEEEIAAALATER
ncbi:MAG: CoA transferase [Planctomycetota bacterium]|jgi:crotonobetainyl-CoA:carnitine CoA-transferase CaiB-like acyl-CoA transferase|nr:CoA transferase [Planctomycetota bacterium]